MEVCGTRDHAGLSSRHTCCVAWQAMVSTSTLLSGFARAAALASLSAAVLASFLVVGDSGCQGGCVRIDTTGYDVSCQKDTDCAAVYSGSICPNYGCLCGSNAAINVSGLASY